MELAGEGDRPEADSTEEAIFGDGADATSVTGMQIERLDGFVIGTENGEGHEQLYKANKSS